MKNGDFEVMAEQAYIVDFITGECCPCADRSGVQQSAIAACVTLLLYDHLLTIDQEVRRAYSLALTRAD